MMTLSDVPTVSGTPPAQIWAFSTADRQQRAIRCMAQMAVQGASVAVDHPVPGIRHEQRRPFQNQSPAT